MRASCCRARTSRGHVVRIGYTAPDFPANQPYFDGLIAEVRFYDRALSREDVAAAGRDGNASADHLVARWRLDTAPEGNVPDATGHGHDGRSDPGPAPVGASRRSWPGSPRRWPASSGAATDDGHLRLKIPAGAAPLRFTLRLTGVATEADVEGAGRASISETSSPLDLESLTTGRPAALARALSPHEARLGADDGPFAVDVLTHPESNPWLCQMRFTGFDFFPGGRRAGRLHLGRRRLAGRRDRRPAGEA